MTMSFVSVFMAAKCLTEFYRNGSLFLPPRPRGSRSLAFIVLFSPLLLIYNRLFSDSECFLSLNYSPVFCAQTVINWSCWCFAIVPGVLMRPFLFRGFFTVETHHVCNLQWVWVCSSNNADKLQRNDYKAILPFSEYKCSLLSALILLKAD